MDLKEQIRSATLQEIQNFELDALYIGVSPNHHILTSLRNVGIISDEDIEAWLEVAVLTEARKDFDYLTTQGSFDRKADHLGHNEFLAYGLNENIFSRKESKKIPFDHGAGPKSYIERYHHGNLLSELREKLLNPVPVSLGRGTDPHPVCGDFH